MNLPRVAAATAGAATLLLALALLWEARATPHARGAPLGALLGALLLLPPALGASLALALPHSPLARAALPVGHVLGALQAAGMAWFYTRPDAIDALDVPRTAAAGALLATALFVAAIAWAARPGRAATLAVRAFAGLLVLVTLLTLALGGAIRPDGEARALLVMGLAIIPTMALAVGLRERSPTTF